MAQDLGLGKDEITLVMTDVQASSKLWEWYADSLIPQTLVSHMSLLHVSQVSLLYRNIESFLPCAQLQVWVILSPSCIFTRTLLLASLSGIWHP